MGRNLRVRLLGELQVTRDDRSVLEADDFRTAKTTDLLRILALNDGRPVCQSDLLERLWPDVSPEKGRASLRTASSQIRRIAGLNCITRHPGALLLVDAWVDVGQFESDARGVERAARTGHHLRALTLTLAAERLYRGDFHAHDDESAWARATRDQLTRTRQQTLCSGAEGALALGRYPDALELASVAVRLGGAPESAHRALMRAHAELGEIGKALRAYESYRQALSDEFGVDPSVQTRELHLKLLRGDPPATRPTELT